MSRVPSWLRRGWKLALALVLGVGIGLSVPLIMTLFQLDKPPSTYQIRAEMPTSGPALGDALYQVVGATMESGNAVELVENGRVFDVLVDEILRAQQSIHVTMYIWEPGIASVRVTAALIARARAGVACRVLIDAFGSADFPETIAPSLEEAGCVVRIFRKLPGPSPLARNHRKLVVLDGTRAILGGFGVRDNWLGDGVTAEGWRDTNVRFSGPAVRAAQQAFAESWHEAGGDLLPASVFAATTTAAAGSVAAAFVASTGAPVATHAERITQLVIAAAKRRLWITNAYFAPSPAILELIERRAAAGVEIRILVPGTKSDSKPALAMQHKLYPRLRKAGIRVWEYQPSMFHSKSMLADDSLLMVGSVNLDPLSLDKLDEVALIIDDRALATQADAQFLADLTHAKEIDP